MRFYTGSWVFDKAGHPTFIDFINWWVAGRFALARNAAGAYDFATFSAAQAFLAKSTPPISYYYWVYPPTMLLLVAPLAWLSYGAAFFAWTAATLSVYEFALYEILPFSLAIVLVLLPLPVINNLFDGQTAFLMTGLIGLSVVFMGRRPYLSGICLGLLTYKPQYVLFFALALAITRQWRVIAAAAASSVLFASAAVLAFGFNAWELFLRSLREHNPATFLPSGIHFEIVNQTVFGLMHEGEAGRIASWVTHLAVVLLTTAVACVIWSRPVPNSLKAAAFSIGALIVTPYMQIYDLTALSLPAAFLVQDALARGFLPGERFALTGCFLALLLSFNFPVGPIVMLVLLGLIVRRVSYAMKNSVPIDAVPQLAPVL